jgi:hypothetical protein
MDRVMIGRASIQIQLSEVAEADAGARILTLPCRCPRPIAILIEALGAAHRWLTELLSDPRQTLESLALREGKTDRSIRMTLSLAFLAPDIVKTAVEGPLRGFGLKRLVDLSMAWLGQWRALGLQTPARA